MTKMTKLTELFAKVSESYTITNCHNGFFIDVSGENSNNDWVCAKYVFNTLEELLEAVKDLAWMPKS
jgi:hypothetical protein